MKNIFISSTFIDMQAERDMVQERVLPALREEARKYGDNVGVIDLRWGVDTSTLETEEGAAKVLKVCLDEIDRSHPYMLIFLGERYGTMMREDQIEKSVRGRKDKYITDDYVKSITALEVEYGALSEKYGELNHCVVCFREPVVHMLDGAEKDLYAEHKEEGKRKLEALKERIKHDLGEEDRLITYSCTWDPSARQLVNFVSKGQPLENVLTTCFAEMFKDDWKEYEDLSWQDKEQLAFRALMESKVSTFVGREELLEEYYRSTVNGTCPIILQGETGSGKTAIMCKIVERLQKEGKNVFAFFSGTGSMSTNADSLVRQMVYYMENLLGIEEHFGETEAADETDGISELEIHSTQKNVQYDDWMERLEELCFGLTEGEKVYFCIDALDQLFLDEHVEKLDFFVKGKKVQIVASCTDTFALPADVMADREVKYIPALSERDAKKVAEGILASYSRNAYAAIEEEILKKKSTGNPLYISLLIQRLNMMDTEELREAMTEEEIVALGVRIIKEMPEETKEAIVSVIRDGIEKISEEQELLFETLQYLAISRNGLRMSDLQGIFAAQGRVLPTLDITLLMKYLDSFFYVHEDDRIDFTHKVIRQGLLKVLTDRETKEEVIKEHLKTLDTTDGLRMREGMYFARIQQDEKFAKELIRQAYLERDEELVKAIKNEAVADSGDFYCRIIEKETREVSMVRDFFLWRLPAQLGLAKEEMQAKLRVGESLVLCQERIHEKNGSEASLRDLSNSYDDVGSALLSLGQAREALLYFEKALKCAEELYEKNGSEKSLRDLIIAYNNMGHVLRRLGRAREALRYCEKALKCAEELHEKNGSEESLQDLVISYTVMGNALEDSGKVREALAYYEKALKCVEELHEKNGSEESLRDLLIISYHNMGSALKELGRAREALSYYEGALKCAEELHKKNRSEASLRTLSISYHNMGNALEYLGKERETLTYYEKALKCVEELHEKIGSKRSLRNLSISYYNMGDVLRRLGRAREALPYFERQIKCAEELHEKNGSEESLLDLFTSYYNIGDVLKDLGQAREALPYYEKQIKCAEELHEKNGSEESLWELSSSYKNMGWALEELGQSREALVYCEKALQCAKQLHEKSGSDLSLRELSLSYSNMGHALIALGQSEEALEYYEKALKCKKQLHEKIGSESSLRELSISYDNMGDALKASGPTSAFREVIVNHARKALVYYEKALRCREELYEKSGSEKSLCDLANSYYDMYEKATKVGMFREAIQYHEKALKCVEQLQEKGGSIEV